MFNSLIVLAGDPSTFYTGGPQDPTGILAIFGSIYLILIAATVIYLMSLYNLVMYDSQYFSTGETEKQLWFWLLTFVPPTALYYFFAIRPSVRQRKIAMYQQYYANQAQMQSQQNSQVNNGPIQQ